MGCGLVSGQDWLHWFGGSSVNEGVADWSQAKIGYTPNFRAQVSRMVADWSQAKIGYTTGI